MIWMCMIGFLLSIGVGTACSKVDPARDFYQDIVDICAPTQEELWVLQNRLLTTPRPILDQMNDTAFIPKSFRFIGTREETPLFGRLVLNSSEFNKDRCIILYSSFNARYPLGVYRLLDVISQSDYRGHVYYRIGGWPNVENGDLQLIHVPFAFKPCFFKEMQNKGYQQVLWLDASILPIPEVSLNSIFDLIHQLGVFIQAGDHTIGPFMNEDTAKAFGLSLMEASSIWSCSAAIIGIDFENPKAAALLNAWHQSAYDPSAFFSARSDQNALSILIHQYGFEKDLIPRNQLGSLENSNNSLFIMDRSYVKDW